MNKKESNPNEAAAPPESAAKQSPTDQENTPIQNPPMDDWRERVKRSVQQGLKAAQMHEMRLDEPLISSKDEFKRLASQAGQLERVRRRYLAEQSKNKGFGPLDDPEENPEE